MKKFADTAQRMTVGPYPFFCVYEQSPAFTVLWCIAILGMDYLYAWLLWKGNGGKKKQ